jgi:hypothetical protein
MKLFFINRGNFFFDAFLSISKKQLNLEKKKLELKILEKKYKNSRRKKSIFDISFYSLELEYNQKENKLGKKKETKK